MKLLLTIALTSIFTFPLVNSDDPYDWEALFRQQQVVLRSGGYFADADLRTSSTTTELPPILQQLKGLNLSVHQIREGEDIPLHPYFRIYSFMGRWFEMFRTKTVRESRREAGATDVQVEYWLNDDGKISMSLRNWYPFFQKFTEQNATGEVIGPARMKVKYDANTSLPADYRVLYTDYKNVAVVYAEKRHFFRTSKYAWVYARNISLPIDKVMLAFEIATSRTMLKVEDFKVTRHGIAPPEIPYKDPQEFKCLYVMDRNNIQCNYIGQYIVFDSIDQLCGIQDRDCIGDTVRNAFSTFTDCQRVCLARRFRRNV